MRRCSFLLAISLVGAIGISGPSLLAQTTKIRGSDVVINGESFFDMTDQIKAGLEKHARDDGYIGVTEKFRQIAVSGSNISRIMGYFDTCTPKPLYLISDGGGIDLMSSCPSPVTAECAIIKSCKTTLQQYIDKMKAAGVKKFLWMCYPDPVASKGWATLKANQDVWAVEAKKIVLATTNPKPLWVDLRPVWAGHYDQYTTDGIHPTDAGSQATADAFWKAIKDSNFFDLGVPVEPSRITKTAQSVFRELIVLHNTLALSLFLAQPSKVTVRITTISGRTVLTGMQQEAGQGLKTVQFPLRGVTPGAYCLEVQAGRLRNQSRVLVQ